MRRQDSSGGLTCPPLSTALSQLTATTILASLSCTPATILNHIGIRNASVVTITVQPRDMLIG